MPLNPSEKNRAEKRGDIHNRLNEMAAEILQWNTSSADALSLPERQDIAKGAKAMIALGKKLRGAK